MHLLNILVLSSAMAVSCVPALATPLDNISGMSGRVEGIGNCASSYLMPQKKFNVIANRCRHALDSGECFKQHGKEVEADFIGNAIDGQTDFDMKIVLKSKAFLVHSIRTGSQTEGEGKMLSLMFTIKDGYSQHNVIKANFIQIDHLRGMINHLIVPVKRRILSDLNYIFLNCELVINQENPIDS